MKTLHFSTYIQAPAEKVWDTLWNAKTYPHWSSIFAQGSRIETDWTEGSRIRFLDKAGNGVYGIVHKHIPNKLVSILNLGELFEGREQIVDERTSASEWSGAIENYCLNEKRGITSIWVELEVSKNDAQLFAEKFPKALAKIKAMAEERLEVPLPLEQEVEWKVAV